MVCHRALSVVPFSSFRDTPNDFLTLSAITLYLTTASLVTTNSTNLVISLSFKNNIVYSTQSCLSDLKTWMTNNKLQLNDDTADMIFTTPRKEPKQRHASSVYQSEWNQQLRFHKRISHVCRTCYPELRRIGSIRHYMSLDAIKSLICACVLSRVDYCKLELS